jgi:hypothetical protein
LSGLVYCACGHLADEHRPGLGCQHVNAASKRFAASARCHCGRFTPNAELGDPTDFVAKQLNHVLAKQKIPVEPVEREELLQVMHVSLWRAALKYDSRSHIRFGSFAAFELYQDAIDEMRSARMFGRDGKHRLPPQPPSDVDGDGNWNFERLDPLDELDDDAAGSRRLERAVAGVSTDAEDVGSLSLGWALAARDRGSNGSVRDRDRQSDRTAEGRAGSPGWAVALAATRATQPEEEAA